VNAVRAFCASEGRRSKGGVAEVGEFGRVGGMAKRKSTAQRIVYAGLLMPLKHFSPADKNRVLRANGEGKKSPKQVIYVGETGLTTEERYLQHLLRYKSQRGWIYKYGIRPIELSTRLADIEGLKPAVKREIYMLSRPLRTDSKQREAAVAEIFRREGFYVVSA
jgi:hypothetical protein